MSNETPKELFIVEYIIAEKIEGAILQSIIELKQETDGRVDFISLSELAFAVASDTIRNLQKAGLIEIKESK